MLLLQRIELKNPGRWLLFAVTATSAALFYLMLVNVESSRALLEQTLTQVEKSQTRNKFLELNNLLSSTAMLYAITSNERWKLQYDEYALHLQQVIERSQHLKSEYHGNFGMAKILIANQSLIEFESRAFALVAAGNNDLAQALLQSEDYLRSKGEYALGMIQFASPDDAVVRISELAGLIDYYDSGLTIAAKLFANSGDPAWEDRYNQLAINLDSAINETQQLIDNDQMASVIKSVGQANEALVEIESRAIELAKADDFNKASDLLENDDYLKHKNSYSLGMQQLNAVMNDELEQVRAAREREVNRHFILTLILVLVLVGCSFSVVFSIRSRQKELQDKNVLLGELNEDLEQFAYRSSHDLKSPLISIRGLAKYIGQDIKAGALQEASINAKRIETEALVLENLVLNILDLAKADSAVEESVEINLQDLVGEIEAKYEQVIRDKGISFSWHQEKSLTLVTQKTRLSQILENLVSNSIKYSDPNKQKPFIAINARTDATQVYLSVKDNGLGIPESMQREVFKLFKRYHPEAGEGSGIGLSIIKKHVDRMKAKIELTSSPQETIFTLAIPK